MSSSEASVRTPRPIPPPTPGRLLRLRRRLPFTVRRHGKLLAGAVAVVGLLVALFGDVGLRPVVTSTGAPSDAAAITENIVGTQPFFDSEDPHEVSLTITAANYDDLIDAFFEDNDKDWVPADLVIDGTAIPSVGIRLKGNSTLMSLTDDRPGMTPRTRLPRAGVGGAGAVGVPGGGVGGGAGGVPGAGAGGGGAGGIPGGGAGGGGAGGGFGGLTAPMYTSKPETLPLLISFDEYDKGRAYQGMTRLAVRPGGSSGTALNEAVSLQLTRVSGQATQRYSYTSFAVNGRAATTRLVIEEPDATYAERLADRPGVLYKVLSTSTFRYKGEDQTEYGTEFDQINLKDSHDLQPVLSFLKWLDSASDEEFAADLGRWVDVDSLATYIATQNLLNNFDSLSGPGHNGYLRYDLDTKMFSVVSWDLNLALIGFGGGAGGGFGGFGGGMPDVDALPQGAPGAMPAAPGGQAGGAGPPGAGPGGGGNLRMGNTLITRFNAVEAFKTKVSSETDRLRSQLFTSGAALKTLDRVAASVPVTAGLTKQTITAEVERLRTTITSVGKAKSGT